MDLRMPIMGGLEATQEIRKREKVRRVKIICLTASAFLEDREQVIAAGMDAFMTKPVRATELFTQLQQMLGLSYREPEIVPGTPEPDTLPSTNGLKLPEPLASQLRRAVEEADLDQVLALADELGAHDTVQSDQIRRLAQQFQYTKLLSLLESHPPTNP
jgi:CheY-like chemotaxis protein